MSAIASPLSSLAHRVEHAIEGLAALREILRRVVNSAVRAEAHDEIEMRAVVIVKVLLSVLPTQRSSKGISDGCQRQGQDDDVEERLAPQS